MFVKEPKSLQYKFLLHFVVCFVFFCFHLGFVVVVVFIVHSVQSKEGDLRYWS